MKSPKHFGSYESKEFAENIVKELKEKTSLLMDKFYQNSFYHNRTCSNFFKESLSPSSEYRDKKTGYYPKIKTFIISSCYYDGLASSLDEDEEIRNAFKSELEKNGWVFDYSMFTYMFYPPESTEAIIELSSSRQMLRDAEAKLGF